MLSVHVVVGSPWAEGASLISGGVALPWRDGATVHAGMSAYVPGAPAAGGTPTGPVPASVLRIDARQTYTVVHNVSVVDLRDAAALDVFDVSMSIDEDSALWTLRASGPGALYATLVGGEQPAQVEVTIDGLTWRFVVDSISRAREFGGTTATFAGRSLAVLAGAPYEAVQNWVNDGPSTGAQVAAVANIYTGLAVSWEVEDWLIPDRVFSFTGTPLAVVNRVAEAVGAVVQADRADYGVRVMPRYPRLPNEWAVTPPSVVVAFEAVVSEQFERADTPEYTGVYVSGQQQGAVGFVRLAGTAGANLHPLVTDPLLTEAPALRQRGEAILGASGGQARVTQVLPVLTGTGEPGVLSVGQLVRVLDPDAAWMGLVRAVSVAASSVDRDPRVRQSVVLERHTKDVDYTTRPPPVQQG